MVTPAVWPTAVNAFENQTPDGNTSSKFLESEFRYTLFPIFYGVVFVLGLAANCYALYVLHKMRDSKAMNEIRIYMTNLTVADLLFVSALPFWIGYYANKGDWKYSDVVCRITGSFFFINTYCSIFFLAVISINRYWAVTRPLVAASSDCWKRGAIISAGVWAVTLSVSIKFLIDPGLQKDGEKNRCFEGYHNETDDTKNTVATTHFLIIAVFFVVFLLVILCNISIARTLLSQPISQPRASTGKRPGGTKRRALKMLFAVVGVFVICFLPHHVVQGPWVLAVLDLRKYQFSMKSRQLVNDAHQITLMLMGLNCILDPLVYCFATTKFRKYIQGHFKKAKDKKNCSRHTLSTAMSLKSRNQTEL
ncbi:platelet-activating factor receptor isoform X2 [Paramisgurnus dabryanus]|uniref:platelet-activating factor receptor isoform X2 n=1 Tax=Paramisgurnus dabryanus TaxID=90735 RepID=UPI003CCF44C6